MADLALKIKITEEFAEWYDELQDTLQTRIDARLERLKTGNFGDSKSLGEGLFELKWKNGMRVYYSRKKVGDVDTIILWGGDKATQRSDIKKARNLKEIYEEKLED